MATAILPTVRPISDLRTRLNEIEEEAHITGEPIVLTRNGKSSLVIMDSTSYDELVKRERAIRKLREAEIEAKYVGSAIPAENVRERIAEIIETGRASNAPD